MRVETVKGELRGDNCVNVEIDIVAVIKQVTRCNWEDVIKQDRRGTGCRTS